MSNTDLSTNNTPMPSGSVNFIEASYTNLLVDYNTLLSAVNGPEAQGAGVTFTLISPDALNPLTGYNQFQFTVNNGLTVLPSTVTQCLFDELNTIPGLVGVTMGDTYTGAVNQILSPTNITIATVIVIAVVIAILFLEKSV
jgi:hypothetical protein